MHEFDLYSSHYGINTKQHLIYVDCKWNSVGLYSEAQRELIYKGLFPLQKLSCISYQYTAGQD